MVQIKSAVLEIVELFRRILSFSFCLSLSSLALKMWRVYIFWSSDVWMCYTMCSLWCLIRRDDWLRIYSICSVAARAAEIWKEKRESQCVFVCAFLCTISQSQLRSSWVAPQKNIIDMKFGNYTMLVKFPTIQEVTADASRT